MSDGRPLGYLEDLIARLELSDASGQLPKEDREAIERVNASIRTLGEIWTALEAPGVDPILKRGLQGAITALSQLVDAAAQLRDARQARFERDVRARLEKLEARPVDKGPAMGVF